MRFAIIGTGFVADYYMTTLVNHPELELAGVFDTNSVRLQQFCAFHKVKPYESMAALLADDSVDMVAVLTTPETHFEITSAVLDAGKHVYCEKPLATDMDNACKLVTQAANARLIIAGAPANAYSEAFLATKNALDTSEIGTPKLVYAEMEDGAVFRERWQEWRSQSGAPWPGRHEFEIGCTLEHAGYGLSWLVGLFGSIRHISGTSATLFLDKGVDIALENMAPDFSTAVLAFENGVIARLTCGLCAPKDRSLTIMGDGGTLTVADLWDNRSQIHIERIGENPSTLFRVFRRLEAIRGKFLPAKIPAGRKLKYGNLRKSALPSYPSQIDFAAGLLQIAKSAQGAGKSRKVLAAEALHITEAALALNRISDHDGRYIMTSSI
ncbi:MAG: Gfo/Idh/MocA family oxidoreductase [Ahrensia sp.]|nr:Gfo/Idh/MocA family oxidoreductase [Ahrensia sp.]